MNENALRYGILVRFFQDKDHIIVFDQFFGKMVLYSNMITNRVRIHGGLILYECSLLKQHWKLISIDLVAEPNLWVYQDVLFLHHVLEILMLFIPEGLVLETIFQFFAQWYTHIPEHIFLDLCIIKKLFLGKFFALLGVYPDQLVCEEFGELFYAFSSTDDYLMYIQSRNVVDLKKKIQVWLQSCVVQHPLANKISTIDFLSITS